MRSMGRDGRAYVKPLQWTFVVAGALAWAGAAPAATPPPPEDVPVVSAYVELVPTSGGSRSPRVGAGGSVELPARVEAQLARQGGTDAALLKKVATSAAYGAPRPGGKRQAPSTPDDQTALAAGIGAATGGGGRMLLLGGVLFGMTAGALGAAAHRRREAHSSS